MTAATSTMPVLDTTTNQAAAVVAETEKKAKKPIRQVKYILESLFFAVTLIIYLCRL